MTKNPGRCAFLLRFTTLSLFTVAVFFLGKHWSDAYHQIIFLARDSRLTTDVGQVSSLVEETVHRVVGIPPESPSFLPEKIGIINEDGKMSDVMVGEYDDAREKEEEDEFDEQTPAEKEAPEVQNGEGEKAIKVAGRFQTCPRNMSDYVPCFYGRTMISSSSKLKKVFRRSCHSLEKSPDCLVPTPANYRTPIPWPASRNQVWYDNVPHTKLEEYNVGEKKLITREGDKLMFSDGRGGGFSDGVDAYLDQIAKMVPKIGFGSRTRLALDIGCGVTSFGAFLESWNVTTLSITAKDGRCGNHVQLDLERGSPAMIAGLDTHRLLYPSQAFELIHCANCEVNWTHDDGMLLLEANRLLRAGGYFVWSEAPPRTQWRGMERLTFWLCWGLVKREGYITVWRKTQDNGCYFNLQPDQAQLPLCDRDDDPDDVWDVKLKACISRLPENGVGGNISSWPERLRSPPDRLWILKMEAYTSRKELFKAESHYWSNVAGGYVQIFRWASMPHRNILDMRAGFGGFAAAVEDAEIHSWVMNVVPASEPNTLPVIYDRGLIGVIHDWCEPFDTYPRTYDIINAASLFSKEQYRCNISIIMLEVDRILRPGGRVYIRDTKQVLEVVERYAGAMGWGVAIFPASTGPCSSRKLLICEKRR